MHNKFLIRLYAVILAICIAITGTTAVQIMKVYADEGGEMFEENAEFYEEGESYTDDDSWLNSEEVQKLQSEATADDYNISCYTPNISFGTVYEGEIVYAKQFNVVNTGNTTFPITWDEVDPYTAFDMGSITANNEMAPGDTHTFSVSPMEGLAPGTYSARYTFFSANDIGRHHTAVVDVKVTVKADAPYISSVEITPGSVTVPVGKSYRFEAYVSGGNNYDSTVTWSLTGNQSQSTTIDGNGKLTVGAAETAASFAVIATSRQDPSVLDRAIVTVTSVDYVVSVKAEPKSGGAVAGGGAVRSGGSCYISASANNNYSFVGWYENGNLVSSRGQISLDYIDCDRNLIAKFERQTCYVKTSVNDADAGTVTKSASVANGGSMTITAKAKSGYSFAGFVENNKTISKSSSLELNNITTDRNIVAVFVRDSCTVNVYVNPQDTGKFEGAGTYNKGSRVELNATAYDGYEFSGWSINGQIVSRDRRYVINELNSDVNVVANFMKRNAVTYKITSGIARTGGGAITPSGENVVAEGGSITFNIIAQADYNIASVIVDGKDIGAVASYTFNNVRTGHTITASFAKKPSEAPKQSAQATEQKTQKKTEYNEKTAAQGAVPEQKVVEETEEIKVTDNTEASAEDYVEDVVIVAEEAEEETYVDNSTVMAKHNLDADTLRLLIKDNAVLPMLKEAFEDGTLQITVNNTYAADKQETAVELYHSQPTLVNFQDVIAETLTEEEKFSVLNGTPVSFNIDITENTDTIDADTKKVMQKKVGYKPVSYFDFLILKTSNGTTSVINSTSAELEVVIPIPEQYQKKGRKFYVIRNHNGVVDILQDIGTDSSTVTFRTDRFSEYAIAYEAINVNKLILRFAVVALLSLVLALICFINLIKYKRRRG